MPLDDSTPDAPRSPRFWRITNAARAQWEALPPDARRYAARAMARAGFVLDEPIAGYDGGRDALEPVRLVPVWGTTRP